MNEEAMEVILVEDDGWKRLRPLTWLRPAGELLVGARTNAERWELLSATRPLAWCRPEVAAIDRGRRTGEAPPDSRRRLWVRDRWIPDPEWASGALSAAGSVCWRKDGATVAAVRTTSPPDGIPPGSDGFWEALTAGSEVIDRCAGAWIDELSDLISEGARMLGADLESQLDAPGSPEGFGDGFAYARGRVRVGKGCQIDHGAVLDAREGPIVLGAGTKVYPGTWIHGPFGCRENCVLLGGRIGGGSYFGAGCRVRGEVEATFILGNGNKAHDGFVGHSYVAEWVNLGALTTTSDLKNNYGPVHLDAYGRRVDTGQQKIGSFIGDHAKTRIGTLLNSGSVIGLAANLFDEASLFPKWIPDLAWGGGPGTGEYELDRCMRTVQVVMERRGARYPGELRGAFEAARAMRKD